MAKAEVQSPGGDGRQNFTALIIICAMMLLEGVGIYFAISMLSESPQEAAAAAEEVAEPGQLPGEEESADAPALIEVFVAQCKPTNSFGGRLAYYSMKVAVLVRKDAGLSGEPGGASAEGDKADHPIKKLVESNQSRLEERINVVIRSSDPRYLNEPGFQSLKRMLKEEFGRVLGDEELIYEVVIPELIRMSGEH